jgi:flagellar assembly protein FliH
MTIMTDNKFNNRIPFEQIDKAKAWTLPSLSSGKVVSSVKKQNGRDDKNIGKEIIEEVAPAKIKPLTAEQLQQIAAQAEQEGRERGYQEGLQKGYAEGEKKGLQKGEQKAYSEIKTALDDQKHRFQSIADALLDPMKTQDASLENTILDMAVHLAKHLLNRELTEDPSGLFHLVERAVGSLPAGAKNIRIYLHPDDVELAHEAFAHLGRNWNFYPDTHLSRGGCRVETDQSLVNYSVEQRLRVMLEQANFLGDLDDGEAFPIAHYEPPAEAAPALPDADGIGPLEEPDEFGAYGEPDERV